MMHMSSGIKSKISSRWGKGRQKRNTAHKKKREISFSQFDVEDEVKIKKKVEGEGE